jgi:hypothetical protein
VTTGEPAITPFIDGEFLRATAKDRAEYNKVALGAGGNPGWATINDVHNWTTWTSTRAAITSTPDQCWSYWAGWYPEGRASTVGRTRR